MCIAYCLDLGGRIVNNTQLQQIERSIYGITDHKQLLHTEGLLLPAVWDDGNNCVSVQIFDT